MALGMPREPFHVLRPRNVLIFLSSFCLLVGLQTGNAGLWTLGVASAVFMLSGALSVPLLFRHVEVRRVHDARAFQGDELPVELRLRNDSPSGSFLVEIVETFPPASPEFIRSLFADRWGRGREVVIRYRKECHRHRGVYILGPARIVSSDPLGLFERETLIPVFTTLHVYPQAPELMTFDVLGEGTRPHTGVETVRHPGRSEEFVGLREYRHGDPPRRIHWPTSAHHGRLLVKEFQDERTTEVSIVLDLGRLGLTGLGEQTTAEYAIMCAASVARKAHEKSHAFQLFAIGKEITHVPVGGGLQQLLTVLDRLIFLKAEGGRNFAEETTRLRSWFRRGSTVILIFSATTLNLDRMAPLLEDLVWSRIRVIVILINDRTFPKLYREQEKQHLAAAALEEAVTQLRLLGARVHVVERHPEPGTGVREGLAIESVHGAQTVTTEW
jgi:uncharacterized protein (DUF58 family)